MKKIIVIETAKELIDFAYPNRAAGDKEPFLGNEATLVFEHNLCDIRIDEAEGFKLSTDVFAEDILKELAARAHLNIRIT